MSSTSSSWNLVGKYLDQLLDVPVPQRPAALEKLRASQLDPEVLHLIESSLDEDFMPGPVGDVAPGLLAELAETGAEVNGWVGRRLGAWRVTGHLGSGGMGSVFLVERDDGQYRQQAALKVLSHPGPAPTDRFRLERQILAGLDHPRIARLLDGGATDDGLPYLVMEYVDGERIDEHCDRLDLSLRRRLDLFLSVCDAVQFAHQNLIVHRDLKPANILVDRDGRVKLLDFGIAKLLDSHRDASNVTRTRTHPLTPDYAAPEQLREEPITTATDIYALGVLLYRMLAGREPFEFRHAGLREMVEVICETDAPAPSRVTSSISKRRLEGDLDAIVLKAMAKRPQDRYRSVERLAQEIRAYLEGQPVLARAPSAWDRTRKFVHRHRAGVAAAAAVVVALVAGLGAALWQAHERDIAALRAEQEARRATSVRDFLVSLFEAASPARAQRTDLTVYEMFNQGALRLTDDLNESPDIKADLLLTLASITHQFGDQERALELVDESVELLRRLYGAESRQVGDALRLRGSIWGQLGDRDAARSDFGRALAIHEQAEGPGSASVAADLVWLALIDLGSLSSEATKAAEARLAQALEVVRQSGETVEPTIDPASDPAAIEGHLAQVRMRQGEFEEARRLYQRSLAALESRFGEHHPTTVRVRHDLAAVPLYEGHYGVAQENYRRLAAENRTVYGEDHPFTLMTLSNQAIALREGGRSKEAAELFRRILQHIREAGDPNDLRGAVTQSNLALALADEDELDEAEKLLRGALPRLAEQFGAEAPRTTAAMLRLADVLHRRGNLQQAEEYARRALAIRRRAFPERHPTMAYDLTVLGRIALDSGDPSWAVEYLQRVYRARLTSLGENHPDTLASRSALVEIGLTPEAAGQAAGEAGLTVESR